MVQSIVEGCGDGVAGRDADGVSAGFELVAADVVRVHVADEAVVLPVVGLANGCPVCGAVDAWEGICEVDGQSAKPTADAWHLSLGAGGNGSGSAHSER